MTREIASKIATDLIEGGIKTHGILARTADHYSVSIDDVRKIKKYLLQQGNGKAPSGTHWMIYQAELIDNGFADKELNLTQ